jgi:hypothetical protein
MLDRALRLYFAEFWTYVLIVAVVAVPLHLAHSYAFATVIEVHELHEQIAELPADRTVREIGSAELDDYRASLVVLALVEVALMLLVVRPVRFALEDQVSGRLPTALRSWTLGVAGPGGYLRGLVRAPGPVAGALLVAAAVGFLAERVGLLLGEPLGDTRAWIGLGVAQGTARSLAAPIFLVAWALAAHEGRAQRDPSTRRHQKGGEGKGDLG